MTSIILGMLWDYIYCKYRTILITVDHVLHAKPPWLHPSCLYSQSRVNPATTNQCPCRVVTKPLPEDDIQLQWLERVAVGLGLGTIHWWMSMVRGSQMQSPTSTCARMQQGPSASSTSSATGQFSWRRFASKANLLYKENRFLTDIHPEILLYFVTSLANISQSSYVHVVLVIILLSRFWRRFETYSFKFFLFSPASICTNHSNSSTCNFYQFRSMSIIDTFNLPNEIQHLSWPIYFVADLILKRQLHSRKLSWQWKIPIFNRTYIFTWWIVPLPC